MKYQGIPFITTCVMAILVHSAAAQQISRDELLFLTSEWTGERFEDGRPRVSDDILDRMQMVTLEEAWAVLRNNRFNFQFEGDWQVLDSNAVLVGRALTATFVPGRPDIHGQFDKQGQNQGRSGSQNSWPVDMLQQGDVYVADQFGAHLDGPTIGDNVGNAIYANSGRGFVYDGAVRDGGVIFIPPQLAQLVVETSEVVRLRDMFGHLRLSEGVYTSGQIDGRWSDDVERDFSAWMRENIRDLPVSQARIEELLKSRTW